MKSKIAVAFSVCLIGLVGCGKKGLMGSGDDGPARAEELSGGALIDQMSSQSTMTTLKDLYVAADTNVVTDIEEDNTLVSNCQLTLPETEKQVAAHWIPAGTKYRVYAGKIGDDRSLALSIEEGEPFEVPRLSCWTIPGDMQPITVEFLKAALAPSFSIDARQ